MYAYALKRQRQHFSDLLQLFEHWLAEHAYLSTQKVEDSEIYQALLSHKKGQTTKFQQQRLDLELKYLKLDWALYQRAKSLLNKTAFQRFERQMLERLEAEMLQLNRQPWHFGISHLEKTWGQIQLAKGHHARVYQQFHECSQALDYFENELLSEYPEAYLELWQKEVERAIDSRTRDAYKRAASELKKMRSLLCQQIKDKPRWQRYIQELKQRYPKLRALHDELNKARLL